MDSQGDGPTSSSKSSISELRQIKYFNCSPSQNKQDESSAQKQVNQTLPTNICHSNKNLDNLKETPSHSKSITPTTALNTIASIKNISLAKSDGKRDNTMPPCEINIDVGINLRNQKIRKIRCYTCSAVGNERLAVGNEVYKHLFFGCLQCKNCSFKIEKCEQFSDLFFSRTNLCKKTKKCHTFTKWVQDSVQYISYSIRKDLTLANFCTKSKNSPSFSEINQAITNYISSLLFMEKVKPWNSAIFSCKDFLNTSNQVLVKDSKADDRVKGLSNTTFFDVTRRSGSEKDLPPRISGTGLKTCDDRKSGMGPKTTQDSNDGRKSGMGPKITQDSNDDRKSGMGPKTTQDSNDGRKSGMGPKTTQDSNDGRKSGMGPKITQDSNDDRKSDNVPNTTHATTDVSKSDMVPQPSHASTDVSKSDMVPQPTHASTDVSKSVMVPQTSHASTDVSKPDMVTQLTHASTDVRKSDTVPKTTCDSKKGIKSDTVPQTNPGSNDGIKSGRVLQTTGNCDDNDSREPNTTLQTCEGNNSGELNAVLQTTNDDYNSECDNIMTFSDDDTDENSHEDTDENSNEDGSQANASSTRLLPMHEIVKIRKSPVLFSDINYSNKDTPDAEPNRQSNKCSNVKKIKKSTKSQILNGSPKGKLNKSVCSKPGIKSLPLSESDGLDQLKEMENCSSEDRKVPRLKGKRKPHSAGASNPIKRIKVENQGETHQEHLVNDSDLESQQEKFSFVSPLKLIDGRYLVLRSPQKCPDECPECYCPLYPSSVTVSCSTYVIQVVCPECLLYIYILPILKDRLELQKRIMGLG